MRACNCVNGPGPDGCSACGAPGWRSFQVAPSYIPAITEERVREIIREEVGAIRDELIRLGRRGIGLNVLR